MLPLKNAPTRDLEAYRDRLAAIAAHLSWVELDNAKLGDEARSSLSSALYMIRQDAGLVREELKVRARMMPDTLAAD